MPFSPGLRSPMCTKDWQAWHFRNTLFKHLQVKTCSCCFLHSLIVILVVVVTLLKTLAQFASVASMSNQASLRPPTPLATPNPENHEKCFNRGLHQEARHMILQNRFPEHYALQGSAEDSSTAVTPNAASINPEPWIPAPLKLHAPKPPIASH